MKRTASYNNKNFQKIRHFLPINITVASREITTTGLAGGLL